MKKNKDDINFKYELRNLNHKFFKEQNTPTVSVYFLISRNNLLNEIDGFDERF